MTSVEGSTNSMQLKDGEISNTDSPMSSPGSSPSKPEKRVKEVTAAPAVEFISAKEQRLAERAKHVKKPWDDGYNAVKEHVWGEHVVYEENMDDFSVVVPDSEVIGEYDMDPELMRYKYNEAITEAHQEKQNLISRLNKRLRILDEVKGAYLRDIVTMRNVLDEVLTKEEREEVFSEWKLALPSVDMNGPLGLYSPKASAIQMKSCESCGGHVELQTNDMNMTVKLKKEIAFLRKQHENIALDYAKLKTRYENLEGSQNGIYQQLDMEKKSLFVELTEVRAKLVEKTEIADNLDISNKKHREENMRVKNENGDVVKDLDDAIAHIEKLESEQGTNTNKLEIMEFEHHKAVTRMSEDKVKIEEQAKVIGELEATANKLNAIVSELTEQNTSLEHDVVIGKGIIENKLALLEREVDNSSRLADLVTDLQQEVKDALYQNAVDQEMSEQLISQKNGDQWIVEAQVTEMGKKIQNGAQEILDREKKIAELEDTIVERDKTITKLTTTVSLKKQELVAMQSFVSGGGGQSFAGGDRGIAQAMENAVNNVNIPNPSPGMFDPEFRGNTPPRGGLAALASGSFLQINTGGGGDDLLSRAGSFMGTPAAPVVTAETLYKPDLSLLNPLQAAAVKDEIETLDGHVNINVDEAVEEMIRKIQVSTPKVHSTLMGSVSKPASADDSPTGSAPGSSQGARGGSPADNPVRHQLSNIIVNMIRKHDDIKTQQYVVAQKSVVPRGVVGQIAPGMMPNMRAGAESFNPNSNGKVQHSQSFSFSSGMGSLTEDGEEEEDETTSSASAGGGRRGALAAVPSMYGKAAFTLQDSPSNARSSTPTKRSKARPPPVGRDGSTSIADAHPDASKEEMILRESILSILTANVGSIQAKKAFNAMVPLISMYGSTLSACMDGFWQGLILVKRSSDFYNKCMVIFEKMVNTDKNTAAQVGEVCAECVPLAMSTMGEALSSWQTAVRMDMDVADKLEGYIEGQDDNEMLCYTPYGEFFGRDDDLFLPRADVAMAQLEKMTQYCNYCSTHLNNYLVDVLKDWSSSKSVSVEINSIIEKSQNSAKEEMVTENNRLVSELAALHMMLDQTKQMANEARAHETLANAELETLRLLPQQILVLESKNMDVVDKVRDLKRDLEAMQVKKEDLKNHNIALDTRIDRLIQEKKVVVKESEKRRVLINELNQDVKEKNEEIVNFTQEVKEMKRVEFERLYNLATVACQTEPDMKSQANQTEFICPTMSLRTAARVNTASIKPTYPMVFSTTFAETATGGDDNASLTSGSSSASLTNSLAMASQTSASPSMFSSPLPTRSLNGVTGPYSGGINAQRVMSSSKKVGSNMNDIIGLHPASEGGNLSTIQLVSKLNERFAKTNDMSSLGSSTKKKKKRCPKAAHLHASVHGTAALGLLHSRDDDMASLSSGFEAFSDELNDEERRSVGGDADESDTMSVNSSLSWSSSISALTQTSLESPTRGRGVVFNQECVSRDGILAIAKPDGTAVLTTAVDAGSYHMGRAFLGVLDPTNVPLDPTTNTIGTLNVHGSTATNSSPLDKFLEHHQRVVQSNMGAGGGGSVSSVMSTGSSKSAVPLNAAINMFRIGQPRSRNPSIGGEKEKMSHRIPYAGGVGDSRDSSRSNSRAYSRERTYSDISPTKPTLPPLSAYGLSVANNK